MAKTRDLPTELLKNLDPKVKEALTQLPPAMHSRLSELLKQAAALKLPVDKEIQPNRLVKYALLLVTAERELQGAAVSTEHTARARAELLGEKHGFEHGYERVAEAQQIHRRGRQARQCIEASLGRVLKTWREATRVIHKYRAQLPVSALRAVCNPRLEVIENGLRDMRRAVSLDTTLTRPANSSGSSSTRSILACRLWDTLIPRYRCKWREMHELARTWRLTKTDSIESFSSIVRKRRVGMEGMTIRLGSAWMKLFSEDP